MKWNEMQSNEMKWNEMIRIKWTIDSEFHDMNKLIKQLLNMLYFACQSTNWFKNTSFKIRIWDIMINSLHSNH
jgi:hypothetical protein